MENVIEETSVVKIELKTQSMCFFIYFLTSVIFFKLRLSSRY